MDSEIALKLTKEYGTILCIGVPVGTQIGIDGYSFTTGPNFKGIKMVPPGPHLLTYASTSSLNNNIEDSDNSKNKGDVEEEEIEEINNKKNNDNSTTTTDIGVMQSCFLYIPPSKPLDRDNEEENDYRGIVIIKKWNNDIEDFYSGEELEKVMPEDTRSAFIKGVYRFEFDQSLGPYPWIASPENIGQLQTWSALTRYITPRLLDRITPIGGTISGEACGYNQDSQDTRKEQQILADLDLKLSDFKKSRLKHEENKNSNQDDDEDEVEEKIEKEISNMTTNDNEHWGIPYFSRIQKRPKKGSTPAQISKWNLDKSEVLQKVLDRYDGFDEDVLGEIQYSYLLFIYGHAYIAFLQWKNLVILFLQSDDLVKQKLELFTNFFKILKEQLQEGPIDMFTSDLSGNIFIKPLLKNFIESNYPQDSPDAIPQEPGLELNLFKSVLEFKHLVESKFKWNLNIFQSGATTGIGDKIKNNNINNNHQHYDSEFTNDQEEGDYDDEDDEDKPVMVLDPDQFVDLS
eukprot:gene2213-2728_t